MLISVIYISLLKFVISCFDLYFINVIYQWTLLIFDNIKNICILFINKLKFQVLFSFRSHVLLYPSTGPYSDVLCSCHRQSNWLLLMFTVLNLIWPNDPVTQQNAMFSTKLSDCLVFQPKVYKMLNDSLRLKHDDWYRRVKLISCVTQEYEDAYLLFPVSKMPNQHRCLRPILMMMPRGDTTSVSNDGWMNGLAFLPKATSIVG